MSTEVGPGRSANDIRALADQAWLSRIRNDIAAEPSLDDDGAVVIRVTSGSGPSLEGAPPDRTIKLPALGAHQARVTVTIGSSSLQRVVVDAQERLEELTLDGSGGIEEFVINAGHTDRNLTIEGRADVRALRLRGGKFQLLLTGHVQLRGHLTAQSSQVTGGAILEELGGKRVMLGLVNPEQQASDPPVAVTLRSTTTHAPFVCSCLPQRPRCASTPRPWSSIVLNDRWLRCQTTTRFRATGRRRPPCSSG